MKRFLNTLKKRDLLKQYKKSKKFILNNFYSGNLIKYKKPKHKSIIYFRINKQYRALARLQNNTLYVFDIDNHQ